MKSKITTLVENTVAQSGKKLIGEHGLSFYIKKENEVVADTLADDQAVILDTGKGVTVLLGCSHRGSDQHLKPLLCKSAIILGLSQVFNLFFHPADFTGFADIKPGDIGFDIQQRGAVENIDVFYVQCVFFYSDKFYN